MLRSATRLKKPPGTTVPGQLADVKQSCIGSQMQAGTKDTFAMPRPCADHTGKAGCSGITCPRVDTLSQYGAHILGDKVNTKSGPDARTKHIVGFAGSKFDTGLPFINAAPGSITTCGPWPFHINDSEPA